MSSSIVKLMVVESDPFAQRAISGYFASVDDIHLESMYSSGSEAIDGMESASPEVIITDIDGPGVGGLPFVHAIRKLTIRPKILCFMSLVGADQVRAILDAGVRGLLLKDDHPSLLIHAVRLTRTDDILVSPKLVGDLLSSLPLRAQPRVQLSDRERSLARLVGLGLDNAAIGSELNLAPNTVKTYVSRLLRRCECRDRAALVGCAYQWGLID